MGELFNEVHNSLMKGKELVVATVISDQGSTPRSSGSKMVVYHDGSISGTIGGGSVEGDVIRRAIKLFETGTAQIASYDLNHTGTIDDMDLVCGGKMQVLIEYVAADSDYLDIYRLICSEINMSRPFLLIGRVKCDKDTRVERAVLTQDNKWYGKLNKDPVILDKLSGMKRSFGTATLFETEMHKFIVEGIDPPDLVYIMGAGHVSVELAKLTKQVGFKTVVVDDRAEFANKKRFPDADEVHVCKSFNNVFGEFNAPPGSFIVIVTRGHRFDKEVLAQALRSRAGYIGMIGSRKKKKYVYDALVKEGFDQGSLDKVHCPIGHSIAAETPSEIAVSVVAELIQERASLKSNA